MISISQLLIDHVLKWYFCFTLLLGLSGCATTHNCNPRSDPGFFGSINCHGSDAYTKRSEQQKQSVTQALDNKEMMLKEQRESENTFSQLETEIQQADKELNGIEWQLQTLQNSVRQAQGNNSVLSAKVNIFQKKIKKLRSEIKKGHLNKNELKKLQQELQKEQQYHDSMLK